MAQDVAQTPFDAVSSDGISDAFTDREPVADAGKRRGREDHQDELPAQSTSFGLYPAELRMLSQANRPTPAVCAARGDKHRLNPSVWQGQRGRGVYGLWRDDG